MMASEKETFGVTGPTFLTAVDWNNSHHKRSIAACLVQGVCVLEGDRQHNRQGPQALAPQWWEFFGFRLIRTLVDDDDDDQDKSFFGAIYEFNFPYPPHNNYIAQTPPQYVIAFRGMAQDLKLGLQCIINNLLDSRLFKIGMESTRDIVSKAGRQGNVWLAGHSLGSSIALLIGRQIAKSMEIHVESYLFNPPFASAPLERIKNEKVKFGLRLANSVVTAGLAIAANNGKIPKAQQNDPFVALSSWIPYLFVNSSDPVCSEYVGYFEHREKMKAVGVGMIGKLATKHSIGSLVSGARGKDSEAVHLVPSAYLTINCSPSKSVKEAHGIHQWWKKDLEFKYKLYQYK